MIVSIHLLFFLFLSLNLARSVDAKEIKARLELETVRYILQTPEDIFDALSGNATSFFEELDSEIKQTCIRVAVECGIFWQLRSADDFSSIQELLGAVWIILEQMSEMRITNPITFSTYYNESREEELNRAFPARVQALAATPSPSALTPTPQLPRDSDPVQHTLITRLLELQQNPEE